MKLEMETGEHNYSVVFPFEVKWDQQRFQNYMLERWTDSFIFAIVYVVLVFGLQQYMKKRSKFELRSVLRIWNLILAVFSIAGAIRTVPGLVSAISNHSLQYSVCVPIYFHGVISFWGFMFTVSKVYELGDTMFIILRKRQLIFLHWYHHITVLIYVWYSYPEHTAPGRWFMVMNYIVHSFMYTYYALSAFQIFLPKFVSILITSLQLTQMIVGVSINIWIYQIKARGEFCQQSYDNLKYSSIMYFSYFVLFAHFFYSTYILKSKRKKIE